LATESDLARDAAGATGGALGESFALRTAQGDPIMLHHRREHLAVGDSGWNRHFFTSSNQQTPGHPPIVGGVYIPKCN